ncbi:nuclear transport factor 2 family protein [Fibrisoma limi]|uniref:nuclear transport factor 2 family protein n=1 Tax=Fibrisoma limi TaxID=663275 RepID=UPI0011819CC3|nr:nuclear transport factor 2 family protein [Fibrisoma limi]
MLPIIDYMYVAAGDLLISNILEGPIAEQTELVALRNEEKPMDAFEKFYHDDIEKADIDGVTMTGKAVNHQRGLDLLSKITAVRELSNKGFIVAGDRSFTTWQIDFDHVDWAAVKGTEIAIQDWKDGRIVRERIVL